MRPPGRIPRDRLRWCRLDRVKRGKTLPKLDIGAPAPDFRLPSHLGGEVSLSQFRDRQHVVLAFYPKDDTPG